MTSMGMENMWVDAIEERGRGSGRGRKKGRCGDGDVVMTVVDKSGSGSKEWGVVVVETGK